MNLRRKESWAIVACLAVSLIALGLAPTLMPDGYSWITHTTSQSAAQGLDGAWLSRLGFLAFGAAVVWLASVAGSAWGPWGRTLHRLFGVSMVATSAFSHRPFDGGLAYDRVEDLLHSVTATAMGFAFAFGILAVTLRGHRPVHRRVFDGVAIAASIILPLGMVALGSHVGALQRTMFLIAYGWYATEALGVTQKPTRAVVKASA